jgi:hypothetical protein
MSAPSEQQPQLGLLKIMHTWGIVRDAAGSIVVPNTLEVLRAILIHLFVVLEREAQPRVGADPHEFDLQLQTGTEDSDYE